MSAKQLLVDLAVIAIIVLLGALLYLIFPVHIGGTSTTENNLSTTTNTMPDNTSKAELKIEVTKEGSGRAAQNGDTVLVDYTGQLLDGKVFDSSIPRGQPFSLRLGAGQVIPGWELGLVGMKIGETRRLTIPSDLAYGKDGFPGVIPPDATLIFDITLIEIQ